MDTDPDLFELDEAADEAAWREGEAEAEAGLGVPHDEVVAWVQSWNTDHELPMPESRCIG